MGMVEYENYYTGLLKAGIVISIFVFCAWAVSKAVLLLLVFI